MQKVFDEHLMRNPYLLPTAYVSLTDSGEQFMTKVEARTFVEKHHLNISEV